MGSAWWWQRAPTLQQWCPNKKSLEEFPVRALCPLFHLLGLGRAPHLQQLATRSEFVCARRNIVCHKIFFYNSNAKLSHKCFSVLAYTNESQIVLLYLNRAQIQSIHSQSLSPHYPFSFLLFFSPSSGKPQALSQTCGWYKRRGKFFSNIKMFLNTVL